MDEYEWLYWRIVTHARTKDSQVDISTSWSVEDLLLTQEVYESLDKAEADIRAEQERRGKDR